MCRPIKRNRSIVRGGRNRSDVFFLHLRVHRGRRLGEGGVVGERVVEGQTEGQRRAGSQ